MALPQIDFLDKITPELEQRFWSKVDKRGACWLWRASLAVNYGYGQFSIKNKIFSAHRVAWVITNRRMPDGLLLHSCDNPPCCNPKHLREGTYKDNTQDMISRGRAGYHKIIGANNGNAKLTDEQVLDIVHRYDTGQTRAPKLAKEYGVTTSLIYMILHGKRRKYLIEDRERKPRPPLVGTPYLD